MIANREQGLGKVRC